MDGESLPRVRLDITNTARKRKMADNQQKSDENSSKTIVLTGHGGLDKFKIQNKERPKPGKDEVQVNVKATGINFAELMARQGKEILKLFSLLFNLLLFGDHVSET